MTTEQYLLPIYWASYLINGDATGLEPNEVSEIDQFLQANDLGPCLMVGAESWFSWRNDATTLGGDVVEYTFPVRR
jgi:hypothetical protein